MPEDHGRDPPTQSPPTGGADTSTFAFTFGIYNQATLWTNVRHLTWTDLSDLLTTHTVGAKEGTCIVPAVFRGTRRHKSDAERIDVAFLDSDAGHGLDEISVAIRTLGWAAIISST